MASSFFTKSQLATLYQTQQLSTYAIAASMGCDAKTVYYWLKTYHIPTRQRKIISIKRNQLASLYENGLSLKNIGKKLNLTASAVHRKMEIYHLPRRSSWKANTVHMRYDFSGSSLEKAYLIGFRIGDLNVSYNASSIKVKSNTTHVIQVDLLKALFQKYGPIWISTPASNGNIFHCSIALNKTFSFLIPKPDSIPKWILRSKSHFLSFLAGYIDAEGTIRVYANRARLRIGSYDRHILNDIHEWLVSRDIKNSFRLEDRAAQGKRNADFYRVDIMDKHALLTTLDFIIPHLKHKRRSGDARIALQNVLSRI